MKCRGAMCLNSAGSFDLCGEYSANTAENHNASASKNALSVTAHFRTTAIHALTLHPFCEANRPRVRRTPSVATGKVRTRHPAA